jgi:hypothetical protein
MYCFEVQQSLPVLYRLPNAAFQRFGLCQRGLFPALNTVWKTVLSDAVAVIIRVKGLAAV